MPVLVILTLATLPMLSTAAPPDCRVDHLTDAQYAALPGLPAELEKEARAAPAPSPSPEERSAYGDHEKAGAVAPIGEARLPAGCSRGDSRRVEAD
ncbi:hypothetical protein [Nonomuraea rhizosphaerae]|uniref:hypothetical protein n=1 Tax=Nonomuraea rhizosphaerae TaxID=2665663 RepID=UPI001C5CF85C|nr:hypothetical protein [Nonomuraea rhizosphaerae]